MRVLVAYDGSEQARRALEWAPRVAGESAVTVISVAPTLEASPKIPDAVDPTSNEDVHRHQLDEAATLLGMNGVRVERILRIGNPAEEIINAADEGRFDLILIGIRGISTVRRFLIGSVAERVVRHASVPVLVVR